MELLISAQEGLAQRIELSKSPLSLGRSAENDLAYPNDPWLSRSHLVFERDAEEWRVKDCASRNGTVLNAVPLREAKKIKAADRIYAGHLTIEVCENAAEVARPVVSFTEDESRIRESTIVTSLNKLFTSSGSTPAPDAAFPLSNRRAVRALLKAGQELAGHRPLDALFEVILNLALSAVDAKRGVILTLEAGGELLVRASMGDRFTISTAVRDHVINSRTSMLINDVQRNNALREQHSILINRVRSMMAVPLQTGDNVIGLIYVDNPSVVGDFSREDLDLLTVMANVAAIRIENARLTEVEQAEKLMESELAQASEIQQNLLPSAAPVFAGFDLAGINLCCRTVGGDYYDFLTYPDGRLGLALGDVSGKGMPAALLMCSLQARVQMLREVDLQPDQAMARLNHTERCPPGRFITFFFGVLSPDGTLHYANAGHNYPLLLRRSGEVEELRGNGLPLGIFPDVRYPARAAQMEAGDLLVLYSDGVTEAQNNLGKEFGDEGLARFLQGHRTLPARELVSALVAQVRAWRGNQPFADDFTLLLAKRDPV